MSKTQRRKAKKKVTTNLNKTAIMNRRKTARGNVTRLLTETTAIQADINANIDDITAMIDRLGEARNALDVATTEVMKDVEEDKAEEEWDTVYEYNDRIVTALSKLKSKRDRQISTSTAALNVAGNESSSNSSMHISNVKRDRLPRLELRSFSGDVEEWLPFWEHFRGAIHDNVELSDIEKFAYLSNLLKGNARATLSGLTPSAVCYESAIDMLRDEYGSSDRLIDNIIRKIMEISPIKNPDDIKALRDMYNKITAAIASLNAQKVKVERYAFVFKSVILKTIPDRLRLSYFREGQKAESTADDTKQIDEILKYVKHEIMALEQSRDLMGNEKSSEKLFERDRRSNYADRNERNCSASALYVQSNANVRNENCLFCDAQNHVTSECESDNLTLEKRKEVLRSQNRCFKCTKQGHSARYCRGINVKCKKCGYKHASSVCDPAFNATMKAKREQVQRNDITKTAQPLLTNTESMIQLQTGVANVLNTDSVENQLRILFDGGSDSTFIKEHISRRLKLPIVGNHAISIAPFGCTERPTARLCRKVKLEIQGRHGGTKVELIAIEVPEICMDVIMPPKVRDPQLKGLKFADFYGSNEENRDLLEITVLIGADQYWRVVTGEVKRITEDLVAINSKIGWTIQGSLHNSSTNDHGVAFKRIMHAQVYHENVTDLWNLESIGIVDKREETNFVQRYMNDFIIFKEGRYTAKLPWKKECSNLKPNREIAVARLNSLVSKLSKQNRFEEYDKGINNYINDDIAEKMPEFTEPSERIYFMPHRAVYRDDRETTKVRIVFDASSHGSDEKSLNDCLNAGSNMIPDILAILLNFRRHKIAVTADIEKAFLQVAIHETDRDSHRFLWFDSGKMQEYRMKRLTFGITSSPFVLSCVLKKHFSMYDSEAARVLENSMYVDEAVTGGPDKDYVIQLINDSVKILSEANMNLRKWHSSEGSRCQVAPTE